VGVIYSFAGMNGNGGISIRIDINAGGYKKNNTAENAVYNYF
jgi:hypothetical protein